MTHEEYQWYIKLVRDRYNLLNLSFEQAEQVYRYEEEKNTYSQKHFLTVWEEWDYELTTFRHFLNADQLKAYEAFLEASMRGYEKQLIEEDGKLADDIAWQEALISFYETRFLPDFFKDPFFYLGWSGTDSNKIGFLKKEYKSWLADAKKEILSNHFRHHRIFKPNTLKLSLLRHRLAHILPDHESFKRSMDEPTKAIAHYLQAKFHHIPDRFEKLFTEKYTELDAFREANGRKFPAETGGWYVQIQQRTAEEEIEYRTMILLLLDAKMYGSYCA